jgi:nitroreductase
VAISRPELVAQLDQIGMDYVRQSDPSTFQRRDDRGSRLLYGAPAMIVVARQQGLDSEFTADLDAGIVTSHLVLAATELGYATCISGFARQAFRGPAGQAAWRELGLTDNFDCALGVLVGHPVEPRAPHQPDFTKIIELAPPV